MSRLLSLCLGVLALLSACGPIYDTQYSLVPPTSVEGRRCVGQCQQNRTICRQSCSISQQSCLNEARNHAFYKYQDYVDHQREKKKPIKKSVHDFEDTYACNANSCESRCEADYRDCFGGACGGQVTAQTVCTAFCDEKPRGVPPALFPTAPGVANGAALSGPMSAPMSAPAPTPTPEDADDRSLCRKGRKVEVQSKGDWYSATVKGPLRSNGRCHVHYDGYGSEDDESVSLKRIRPR
ncbi:agenet domain-containing protein [Azospirillum doebereinerae]